MVQIAIGATAFSGIVDTIPVMISAVVVGYIIQTVLGKKDR